VLLQLLLLQCLRQHMLQRLLLLVGQQYQAQPWLQLLRELLLLCLVPGWLLARFLLLLLALACLQQLSCSLLLSSLLLLAGRCLPQPLLLLLLALACLQQLSSLPLLAGRGLRQVLYVHVPVALPCLLLLLRCLLRLLLLRCLLRLLLLRCLLRLLLLAALGLLQPLNVQTHQQVHQAEWLPRLLPQPSCLEQQQLPYELAQQQLQHLCCCCMSPP
jgi:hypothetical protein